MFLEWNSNVVLFRFIPSCVSKPFDNTYFISIINLSDDAVQLDGIVVSFRLLVFQNVSTYFSEVLNWINFTNTDPYIYCNSNATLNWYFSTNPHESIDSNQNIFYSLDSLLQNFPKKYRFYRKPYGFRGSLY